MNDGKWLGMVQGGGLALAMVVAARAARPAPAPDPLTPADLAAAILAVDAVRAKQRETATDLMAKGWQWLRCENGASVWLDSGGAEVRLDGCAP